MTVRIYGIETEYGVTSVTEGPRQSPEEIARRIFRPIVAEYRSSNVFWHNGARIYLDVGSHPEYATAECTTPAELLAQDRAGDVLLGDLVTRAEEALGADGLPTSIFLLRNNVDSQGNSFGCHENYLVHRDDDFTGFATVLVPFLVARTLLCGAGLLHPDGTWELSQRAGQIWEPISSATTRTRPMINTRDEPHADADRYRRLHVIVGDTNIAEPSTAVKVGSTELVLRLIERGIGPGDLALVNAPRALRQASLDPHATLDLADGRSLSAWQILADLWHAVSGADDLDEDLVRVVDLWRRVLEAVETGDSSGIDQEIDWAIKRRLLDQYAHRHGLSMDSPRLAQVAMAYHDTREGRGLGRLLEARGAVQRWTTDDEVASACDEPPATTRAWLRGRFLAAARAAGVDHSVDWLSMRLSQGADARTVLCKDPFRNHDERVDRLIESITTLG